MNDVFLHSTTKEEIQILYNEFLVRIRLLRSEQEQIVEEYRTALEQRKQLRLEAQIDAHYYT